MNKRVGIEYKTRHRTYTAVLVNTDILSVSQTQPEIITDLTKVKVGAYVVCPFTLTVASTGSEHKIKR